MIVKQSTASGLGPSRHLGMCVIQTAFLSSLLPLPLMVYQLFSFFFFCVLSEETDFEVNSTKQKEKRSVALQSKA